MGTKHCVTCAEEIPAAALKCIKCGSYQNWRRHLDLGQGALALLVALISVTTLAVETGSRALQAALVDPLTSELAGNVLGLSLEEVRILVANNGTSRVYLHEGALCRVPVVKNGVDLFTDDGYLVRYPRGNEVEYLYTVSFHGTPESSRFLEGGSGTVITAPRASVLREVSIGIVTGPLIGSQKGPLPLVASGQRA